MSEFHDPQFENALGRLSGEFPDDNVALGAVYQRVQQVRRRRTIVASTAASLLLMTGIGLAAARGVRHDPLQPGASISIDDSTIATTGTTATSTSAAEGTTSPATTHPAHTTTTIPLIVVPTSPPVNSGGSHGSGHTTTVPVVATTSVPTPTTAHTTVPTTPTSTTMPADTIRYDTPGGWFSVRFTNGTLTLVGFAASPGFHIDSQTVDSQRIEFRFRGSGGDFRTRVEVKDGQLQVSH